MCWNGKDLDSVMHELRSDNARGFYGAIRGLKDFETIDPALFDVLVEILISGRIDRHVEKYGPECSFAGGGRLLRRPRSGMVAFL